MRSSARVWDYAAEIHDRNLVARLIWLAVALPAGERHFNYVRNRNLSAGGVELYRNRSL